MAEVKFEDLLGTGAHFGHVTRKWDPNFKPYILLEKNGVHIINLESTIESINKACEYISCLLYTSPSPRDATLSRMPSSA